MPWPRLALTDFYRGGRKTFPRARSEKDITRVSGTLSTGSIPVGRATATHYPYQTRHTFATRNIREGRDPLWIANQMGTSLEMLFKHYDVYFRKKIFAQDLVSNRGRTVLW